MLAYLPLHGEDTHVTQTLGNFLMALLLVMAISVAARAAGPGPQNPGTGTGIGVGIHGMFVDADGDGVCDTYADRATALDGTGRQISRVSQKSRK